MTNSTTSRKAGLPNEQRRARLSAVKAAGVRLAVTHGDAVSQGQPVAKLFARTKSAGLEAAAADLAAAFSFTAEPPPPRQLILK